ncbi:MAG: putative nuclease of restriction endonuclease-like (RecB) superfamily [Paraglaciecola sp.]|jgi:predicted nuclease of restriction endonuclease-like (RecB) superfamily
MTKLIFDQDYKQWISALKQQFRQAQLKAVVKVNSELLQFYWQLGKDILARQQGTQWGDGFLTQLSKDLSTEFPEIKGFSKRNLELIRKWRRYWQQVEVAQPAIAKQLVSQLVQIPWGHNVVIVSQSKNIEQALYYVASTIENGWSRSVLVHQIESGLY